MHGSKSKKRFNATVTSIYIYACHNYFKRHQTISVLIYLLYLLQVTEEMFDGVQVYIYQSHSKKTNRPGLLYFHGGGFRIGHPGKKI